MLHSQVLHVLFAPAESGGLDPSVLLQYGAVGFVALAGIYATITLFNRLIVALERERLRADRLESELRNLNQTTQELMMGALRDATTAVAEALDAVGEYRTKATAPPRRRSTNQ